MNSERVLTRTSICSRIRASRTHHRVRYPDVAPVDDRESGAPGARPPRPTARQRARRGSERESARASHRALKPTALRPMASSNQLEALPPAPAAPRVLEFGARAFCTRHGCKRFCCNNCPQRIAAGNATAHVLFLHTEKTGGSSVECATAGNASLYAHGFWTNMGHTTRNDVAHCRERCKPHAMPSGARRAPLIVLSVREPYHYYRSLYSSAFAGRSSHVHTRLRFEPFMAHYVNSSGPRGENFAQSMMLRRACGEPCAFDHLLRTERLDETWRALLLVSGIPRHLWVALPWSNPSTESRGPTPVINFTERVVAIVATVDAMLFAPPFDYVRRSDAPFIL